MANLASRAFEEQSMTQDAIVPARPLILPVTARRASDEAGWLEKRWSALCRTLALWRHRARSRAELDLIPDHRLNDVAFDTSTVRSERQKPFWKE